MADTKRDIIVDIEGMRGTLTRGLVQRIADVWGRCSEWRRVARIYIPPGPELGARIHAAVRDEVRYRREVGEVVQSPGVTLQHGAGDCDCKSVLVGAVAGAHDMPWRLMLLARSGGELVRVAPHELPGEGVVPFHIWPQLWDSGRWVDCETCHPDEMGHLPRIAYGERPEDVMARFQTTL